MSRKLPRSFFWVDQQLIRNGSWSKLDPLTRLAYVAVAASCDREGVSIWSRNKLMELAGIKDPDEWAIRLEELRHQKLVETNDEAVPPEIRLLPFSTDPNELSASQPRNPMSGAQSAPIVIHTHTSIHLSGDKNTHADTGNSG